MHEKAIKDGIGTKDLHIPKALNYNCVLLMKKVAKYLYARTDMIEIFIKV